MSTALELGLGALAAALATALLIPPARRLGWVDPPPGTASERKLQREPVPTVGGWALALTCAVLLALHGEFALAVPAAFVSFGTAALACGLALVVGGVDDRVPGGLQPWPKVTGQALACLPVAWEVAQSESSGVVALLVGSGVVFAGLFVINAVNVYDNADGALGGVSFLAFALPVPVLGGAALGFLPWNLARIRPSPDSSESGSSARAYLGDAGSHVLGMAFFLVPAAWPVLLVPVADAVRVAFVRRAAGEPPWVGDRRHLAHRLADRGHGPVRVAGLLALAALPSAVGIALARSSALFESQGAGSAAIGVGIALSALAFTLLVRASQPRER